MRTARFHDREDVRVEQIERSPVGEDDVRIEVAACGICGTDLHEYATGPTLTPEEPHPRSGASLPITMGHEFSGTVSDVGESVTDLREGDRVTVNPNIPCRDCRYCDDGLYNVCPHTVAVGYHTGTGGFAESAAVPAQQVHPLPDEVSLEAGAVVEPFAVGMHAVRRSGMRIGDTVAVFGCGPIGLTTIHAANRAGARRIVASEPRAARRETAVAMGADETVNPVETNPVEYVTAVADGGVDAVFEFAGVEASFDAALRSVRRGGVVTVGALSEGTTEVNLDDVVSTERRVVGTNCYAFPPRSSRGEFDAVIRAMAAGDVDVGAFVSDRIDLGDIVGSGFEALFDADGDHVKILVVP
jgi:(R,R)-butanediol dehydrogenase/meso-butanediol dehydrogenase/diacetyl reductase